MKKLLIRLGLLSITIFVITLSVLKLYNTYATGELQSENNTYYFNLDGDTITTVEPLSSKNVYYQIKNTNPGTVKYGVAYNNIDGVTVRAWEGYNAEGLINENDTVTVKLKISNTTNTSQDVELSTILGYENGGALILPRRQTLVSSNRIVYNTNTLIDAFYSSVTENSTF